MTKYLKNTEVKQLSEMLRNSKGLSDVFHIECGLVLAGGYGTMSDFSK
ncbi:hypothetical protein [Chryseobacterium sp. W4I1]|nr:hypothetical protein [Chryseobacterium sp. W4I1]MDQ0782532.1 hypothetical protein [Chryseobacterium sp. W4I1]